ncbi:hypothetical protein D3C80_1034020 [compost metagenome]
MTQPTAIAAAVRGTLPAPEHDADVAGAMRKIMARDAGIIGNRAAMQRSLTGDASATETERERKARLIARGTARLMQMGLTRKEAERVARRSYSLAKQDAKA